MKNVTLSLLVPLLASGCGSSPTSPTAAPTAGQVPFAISYQLHVAPDAEAGKGWRSPTTVRLGVSVITTPAHVERATFRMLDERGEVLAEASFTGTEAALSAGVPTTYSFAKTLAWPLENTYGKRLDAVIALRLPSGELSTFTISSPRT